MKLVHNEEYRFYLLLTYFEIIAEAMAHYSM